MGPKAILTKTGVGKGLDGAGTLAEDRTPVLFTDKKGWHRPPNIPVSIILTVRENNGADWAAWAA